MRPVIHGAIILAEQQFHAALFGLDGIERGKQPQPRQTHEAQHHAAPGQARARSAAPAALTVRSAAAPAHQHLQLLLALAHQIFDLGDLRAFGPVPAAAAARRSVPSAAARAAAISAAAPGPL